MVFSSISFARYRALALTSAQAGMRILLAHFRCIVACTPHLDTPKAEPYGSDALGGDLGLCVGYKNEECRDT
jgi:hypothetical protein